MLRDVRRKFFGQFHQGRLSFRYIHDSGRFFGGNIGIRRRGRKFGAEGGVGSRIELDEQSFGLRFGREVILNLAVNATRSKEGGVQVFNIVCLLRAQIRSRIESSTGERGRTVAKKIFPSSLPTPSKTFKSPESVTCDIGRPDLVLPGYEKYGISSISSSSSREGKAQSMSSMRNIACFGMAETAR